VSELDDWKPSEANQMSWIGNGHWWITVPLGRGNTFEYKYVVVSPNKTVQWEDDIPNRVYDGSKQAVFEEWNREPRGVLYSRRRRDYDVGRR